MAEAPRVDQFKDRDREKARMAKKKRYELRGVRVKEKKKGKIDRSGDPSAAVIRGRKEFDAKHKARSKRVATGTEFPAKAKRQQAARNRALKLLVAAPCSDVYVRSLMARYNRKGEAGIDKMNLPCRKCIDSYQLRTKFLLDKRYKQLIKILLVRGCVEEHPGPEIYSEGRPLFPHCGPMLWEELYHWKHNRVLPNRSCLSCLVMGARYVGLGERSLRALITLKLLADGIEPNPGPRIEEVARWHMELTDHLELITREAPKLAKQLEDQSRFLAWLGRHCEKETASYPGGAVTLEELDEFTRTLQAKKPKPAGCRFMRFVRRAAETRTESKSEKPASSARKEKRIGNPRTIPGWVIEDVEGDGNCFYRSVAKQFNAIKLFKCSAWAHAGVRKLAQKSLRLLGKMSDERDIRSLMLVLKQKHKTDLVVAIVDTRGQHGLYHYTYHYLDDRNRLQQSKEPQKGVLIKLAYNGNHYMSVVSEGPKGPDADASVLCEVREGKLPAEVLTTGDLAVANRVEVGEKPKAGGPGGSIGGSSSGEAKLMDGWRPDVRTLDKLLKITHNDQEYWIKAILKCRLPAPLTQTVDLTYVRTNAVEETDRLCTDANMKMVDKQVVVGVWRYNAPHEYANWPRLHKFLDWCLWRQPLDLNVVLFSPHLVSIGIRDHSIHASRDAVMANTRSRLSRVAGMPLADGCAAQILAGSEFVVEALASSGQLNTWAGLMVADSDPRANGGQAGVMLSATGQVRPISQSQVPFCARNELLREYMQGSHEVVTTWSCPVVHRQATRQSVQIATTRIPCSERIVREWLETSTPCQSSSTNGSRSMSPIGFDEISTLSSHTTSNNGLSRPPTRSRERKSCERCTEEARLLRTFLRPHHWRLQERISRLRR